MTEKKHSSIKHKRNNYFFYLQFIYIAAVFFSSSNISFASSLDGDEASFADIFRLMTGLETDTIGEATIGFPATYFTSKDCIIIKNVKFHFSRQNDNTWDERFTNGGKPIRITKSVEFINCDFPDDYWLVMRNMIFEEIVGFQNCRNIKLFFRECQFQHQFFFYGSQAVFIKFIGCDFNLGLIVGSKSTISDFFEADHCRFNYSENFYRNPRVRESQNVVKSVDRIPAYFRINIPTESGNLFLKHCVFSLPAGLVNAPSMNLDLNHSVFKTLEILDCVIEPTLDISFVTVENQIKFFNNTADHFIVAEAFSFNPSNAKVQWEKLAGRRLAVTADSGGAIYTGSTIDKGNDYDYQTLISVYALMYQMYRSQGSRLAANSCYLEWKDIETEHFGRILQANSSMDVWFNLIMNIFLRIFCDYGTNPMKSMIWSLGVMLSFAIFYMAFPRQSGIAEQEAFLDRIRAYGEYFTEGKTLAEIESDLDIRPDETADERDDLTTFIRQNKNDLPRYYRLFGLQILRHRNFSFRFQILYAKFADRLIGHWSTARKSRRFLVAAVFSVGLALSLSGIFFVRLFDAFFLSINAFSTLGFGEIPLRGAAKYLAIAEGFIGWFLLSIFSVALISQIIQ